MLQTSPLAPDAVSLTLTGLGEVAVNLLWAGRRWHAAATTAAG